MRRSLLPVLLVLTGFLFGLGVSAVWNKRGRQPEAVQKAQPPKRHEPPPLSVENEAQQITTNENTLALTQLPPLDQRCEEGRRLIQQACNLEQPEACQSPYVEENQRKSVSQSILARCKTKEIAACQSLFDVDMHHPVDARQEAINQLSDLCLLGHSRACTASLAVYLGDHDKEKRSHLSKKVVSLCKGRDYVACEFALNGYPPISLSSNERSSILSQTKMAAASGNVAACEALEHVSASDFNQCKHLIDEKPRFPTREMWSKGRTIDERRARFFCESEVVEACIDMLPRLHTHSVGSEIIFSSLSSFCKKNNPEACWALGQEYVKSCPDSEQSP